MAASRPWYFGVFRTPLPSRSSTPHPILLVLGRWLFFLSHVLVPFSGQATLAPHATRADPPCSVFVEVEDSGIVHILRFSGFDEDDFPRKPIRRGVTRCLAAHNAVGLAGESPAVGIDCLST